ncbi:MAG: outer membrane beta-barrel protein [Flavobacterium sp. JAD_PAG50586_2]|nr:MAG: outer membrane beta-barrel protein [Flavobacterium sp. JAD_PAG50586_2]
MAQNNKNTNQSTDDKQVVQTTNDNKVTTSFDQKNINLDGLKGESNSNIIAQETVKKVNDTNAMKSVVSNALEELLNEKESKTKQESKLNRWQLTSNVAPVFLGSVSNGSPIDSTLSKNSKSYNTNVGFGLGVSYAVNKKLSVRTGLNKVSMSYNTNDIVFFTGIQSKRLENVSPTSSSEMIHVEVSNPTTANSSPEAGLMPFENSFTHKNNGYLKQEIGYLEMPVEMTYNLLDKKFGIKIIGGFSTLFLQDNSITIVSAERDTALGKANNLNDVHFSTNLGLGIKYGFMKSFEFNIEPTVKYQLNTFSDNAGNFKPYLFGIYSGISYKF